MICEICNHQTATMWVKAPVVVSRYGVHCSLEPILSCADCGPQAGYKILAPLAPLEPTTSS